MEINGEAQEFAKVPCTALSKLLRIPSEKMAATRALLVT
jgi:hypothetical protein